MSLLRHPCLAQGNQFPHLEGNHKEVGVPEVISCTPINVPQIYTDLHRLSFILKIHPCKAENVFGWHTVEQLFPIVATTKIFESFIVHRKPFYDVLIQSLCSPLTETSALNRFYTIAHRYDNIKVIELHFFALGFPAIAPC